MLRGLSQDNKGTSARLRLRYDIATLGLLIVQYIRGTVKIAIRMLRFPPRAFFPLLMRTRTRR